MRIGVNVVPLNIKMGGLRQYFQRLFRELLATDTANSYVFFYNAANEDELVLLGNDRWRDGAIKVSDQGEILLHLMDLDVYFCPFAVLWPRPLPIPSVVELADIQEVFYPQFFTEDHLRARRQHFAPSTQVADAVITLSEFSKSTIAQQHLVDPDKIFVTPLVTAGGITAVTVGTDLAHLDLPDELIFFPANHWQHKNHDTLLQALALLKREQGVIIPCVCTGFPMDNGYPLLDKIAEYDLIGQVRYVGYVSHDEVRGLYAKAKLLCFPSLFEGFGMPVLEAMEAGCPVVCANATSLPEIVGDAAVLFDPHDCRDLAGALLRVWGDEALRRDLAAKGLERARLFTPGRMAEVHLQAFQYAVDHFLPDSRYVYQHYIWSPLLRKSSPVELNALFRLQQMENSRSWRFTAPLRRLIDKVRR